MDTLLDAGNISSNLFSLRKNKKLTLPPLPMLFEGEFDLLPFLLYDRIIIDGNSIDYLSQEKILSDRSKDLLKGLLQDKVIIEKDYVQILRPLKNKILKNADADYNLLKEDIKLNKVNSRYFQSKREWLNFAKTIGKHPKNSIHFPDTEKSVNDNLKRIIDLKLIPRDFKFLHENIIDVNCAYELSLLLGLPLYCWSDWEPYYEMKSEEQTKEVMKLKEEKEKETTGKIISKMWTLFFPKLRLNLVPPDAFRKLIESKSIKDIRNFVETSKVQPEDITAAWYEDIQAKAKMDHLAINTFTIFSFCSSCIIGLTGGPLVGVGAGLLSFIGDKAFQRLETHENRLLYTFQKAQQIVGEFSGPSSGSPSKSKRGGSYFFMPKTKLLLNDFALRTDG